MSSNLSDFTAVYHVPKQNSPPDPAPESMRASLACYPPLGQVTQVRNREQSFVAILEVPQGREKEPWQVSLWHSNNGAAGGDWAETALAPGGPEHLPTNLQAVDGTTSHLYFATTLSLPESLSFTVKFRPEPDAPWRWVGEEGGLGNGVVLVSDDVLPDGVPESLADLIKDLNPNLKTSSLASQAPRTRLWSAETIVSPASGDESAFTEIPLGVPWGNFLRWFALVRIWTPWLAPRQGKKEFNLDRDAVLCSFLGPRGKHIVLLAVSGVGNVMTLFQSGDFNRVVIKVRNDGEVEGTATILVAVGNDFESANAAVMYHLRTLVVSSKRAMGEYEAELSALSGDVKPEWYENWYDGLGFCTWNALGQRLTDEKVFKAVDTLAENGIKITSLIIDDNWQSIDYRGHGQFQHGWQEFEAEPKAFPQGLKATISQIRSKHRNIQHVAVWHALLGYWGGISPDGKISSAYKTIEVVREDSNRRNLPLGGKMTVVAEEDVSKFYDDFYRFLSSCGVDGVKTDAQFMVDTWTSAKVRRDLTFAYLDAWTIASLRHFSIKAISCMSQVPQIMFHSQLPRNRPAMLCRNSDDFFPDIPESHPWHVWTNAHNSLLTQHLNILPDWDMFQTVHDYSAFHAAARCVSGGPIYITDVPGQHNISLISQMTGVTTQGRTVIFRPSVVGRSIDQYVDYHDNVLLKVGSYHGAAVTGTPILGVFNVSARRLTELIPVSRFSGVLPPMHYVVRTHSTGRVSPPMQMGSAASLVAVSLEQRGYEIFSAYPLSAFDSETRGRVFVANLGLVDKMTGAAAVTSTGQTLMDNGRLFFDTRLKALGVLGVYISKLPDMTIKDDFMVTIQGQAIPPHTVSVSRSDKFVVEIDVETAWKEMSLESGWSNEVEVKLYFNMEKSKSTA